MGRNKKRVKFMLLEMLNSHIKSFWKTRVFIRSTIWKNHSNGFDFTFIFKTILWNSSNFSTWSKSRSCEACVNFLSFEALEVLWLDISEMTFFFSARRFGCLWASEINAFSFCFFYFNWSRASFKCLTFSVVTNPDSFKEVKVVILDSISTISAWSSSCFGVSRARVWSFDCWLSICQSTPAVWWSFEDGLSLELAEFGCFSS